MGKTYQENINQIDSVVRPMQDAIYYISSCGQSFGNSIN